MAVEIRNTSTEEIEKVAERTDGKNQWSTAFPKTLIYPDGAKLEDVEDLTHSGMLRLAGKLQDLRTYEVTSGILDELKREIAE